jgi:hypothetical protein
MTYDNDEQLASLNYQGDQLAASRRDNNIRSYGIIKVIMGPRVVDTLPLRIRCECTTPVCEEIIEVTLTKRRELRRNYPTGFIVVPFHAVSSEDTTLCKTKEFIVLEKTEFSQIVTDL